MNENIVKIAAHLVLAVPVASRGTTGHLDGFSDESVLIGVLYGFVFWGGDGFDDVGGTVLQLSIIERKAKFPLGLISKHWGGTPNRECGNERVN